MIESITLANIATYSRTEPQAITKLKQVNFFYGANGAGKTTISRVIKDSGYSLDSTVTWSQKTPLAAMVYNNDFIKENYKDLEDLKGVFTLGKAEANQLERLKVLQEEKQRHQQQRKRFQQALVGEDGNGGKKGELASLEAKLLAKCWDHKGQVEKINKGFQGAFKGARNSKEAFKARVLKEYISNRSPLVDLDSLLQRASVLYDEAPTPLPLIPSLDLSRLLALEASPVLQKRIIGKEDVNISGLIQRLNNSDWVRQGVKFLERSDDQCPFCQQGVPHDLEHSLSEYFDETFEADSEAVRALRYEYIRAADEMSVNASNIAALEYVHLDKEQFTSNLQAAEAIVQVNKERLAGKTSNPSTIVSLESLESLSNSLEAIVAFANEKAAEHNRLVASFTVEQNKLTGEIWRYLLENDLKPTLSDYFADKAQLDKAIAGVTTSLERAEQDVSKAEIDISKIESSLTSVKPTVIAINAILKDFGFRSFSLDPACEGNCYRLVRADGSDAKSTLSEGEKTFVTFLYFYHLLKGSVTTSGISTDRIIVIDDPVSSLDSDVLFIVGSLIKQLFDEVRDKKSNLKQIFVLTHNIHFHKEITFDQRRPLGKSFPDEGFWIVRKPGDFSEIESYPVNPIKTSYQLLWHELKRQPIQALTVQNTMRRILENYFKILGGVDNQKLIDAFEGHEKIHCKSLLSWVNDGSHYAPDELYVAIGDSMATSYMRIFFKIFKVTEHMAHYKMMMGDDFIDLDPEDNGPSLPAEAEAEAEFSTDGNHRAIVVESIAPRHPDS
ncbi:MAG TPA: hypothetical protein DEW09_08180 [Pseudomonas sp.]|nr:hypothetical protein [Pseudomonas sp.]